MTTRARLVLTASGLLVLLAIAMMLDVPGAMMISRWIIYVAGFAIVVVVGAWLMGPPRYRLPRK